MDPVVQMSEKFLLISVSMTLKSFGRQCLSKGIRRHEGRGEMNRICFHNKGHWSWQDCGKVSLKLLYLRARVLVGELTAEPRLLLSQAERSVPALSMWHCCCCCNRILSSLRFFSEAAWPVQLLEKNEKSLLLPSPNSLKMKYEILCGSVRTLPQAGKDCWLSSASSSLWLSPHRQWAPPCCCSTWEAQVLLHCLSGLGDRVPWDLGELVPGESSWHSAWWWKGDSYAGWQGKLM